MTAPLAPLARPARLAPGDRVAVVAPSGPVPPPRLAAGLAALREWGLDPVAGEHTADTHLRHLAGTDHDRAADLRRAWCDPGVAAVFCARGGYGAQRMADLLDWDALRAAGPKAFVGFSDITALHEAFATRLGFATLHGPVVATDGFLASPAARRSLHRTLFEPDTARTLAGGRTLLPGTARGVTLGGCLSLLASDLATPTGRRSAAGGLVLLEDVEEEPYRIDRYLTQLLRSGWFDGATGVLLGSWRDCGDPDELDALFLDRLGGLGVPLVTDAGFGHGPDPRTVPLGAAAVLDATGDTPVLRLAEPALR
ncbi:LD-carboxypeptidase [Streptomyces sp. NPDC050560]|uniref:LD-carboxypeptidase n=1 Tax=Streptomyces sp. NPDC050560 TaxID=3365630 RepID=UPI0037A4AEDC